MLRTIAMLVACLAAPSLAFAQQKDCSKVPEQYRAMCEGAMAKKADVDKQCGGLKGEELKNCVAQKGIATKGAANPSSPQAAAREYCQKYYKVNDTAEFEKCMRTYIGRPQR
jgi:hypothetical protein